MKNKHTLLFAIAILSLISCRQINNHIKLKKYDGIWIVKSLETTLYDTLGNETGTTSLENLTGELTLKRVRDPETTFTTTNSELTALIGAEGNWAVYYRSKEEVLNFGDKRSTVIKRSKNEMIIAFILGDGTGRRTSKHVFTFEFKEDIEKEKKKKEGEVVIREITFKDSLGNNIVFDYETMNTVPYLDYYKTTVVFKSKTPLAWEQYVSTHYLKFEFLSHTSVFGNGNYPFSSIVSSSSPSAVSSVTYWYYYNSSSYVISATQVNNTFFYGNSFHLDEKSASAKIDKIVFNAKAPGINTSEIKDINISINQ
jgi:hypothetical protein